MGEICRLVKGLSVREALIQLKFSDKRAAGKLAQCIHGAKTTAINNYNMDENRLIVKEAYATKAKYGKKLHYHGKGRASVQNIYFCHLNVAVTEQEYHKNETKIGRYGPKISSIEKTLAKIQEYRENNNKELNDEEVTTQDEEISNKNL